MTCRLSDDRARLVGYDRVNVNNEAHHESASRNGRAKVCAAYLFVRPSVPTMQTFLVFLEFKLDFTLVKKELCPTPYLEATKHQLFDV